MLHFCQRMVIMGPDLVCLKSKALKDIFNPLVHLRWINFFYFSTKHDPLSNVFIQVLIL